ncbi:MAG TPA: DNA-deoxyinosine glycosylase [Burkholderiales bacterium]|jgi:hypoxanthine-DNA glycosylase
MSAAKEAGAESAASIPRLHGLPPVVAADARVLVLGSFPSAASLAARQYYAHPQNRFWLFMGQIFGAAHTNEDWRLLPYERRLRHAKEAGVAIWDIYGSCERSGSLDAAIRNAQYNDFGALLKRAPGIKRVCFNGGTAARAVKHLASFGLQTLALPSTSPANAGQTMDYKLARWREALGN